MNAYELRDYDKYHFIASIVPCVTIQMKAIEQYFHVVLYICFTEQYSAIVFMSIQMFFLLFSTINSKISF